MESKSIIKSPIRGRGLFCRGCRYRLDGLVSPSACPECGRDFDFDDRRTIALDAKPQRQVGQWIVLLVTAVVAFAVAAGVRVAIVWGWNHPISYIPQMWVFIVYPIWQAWIATMVVLVARMIGRPRSTLAGIAVGVAAGALTGLFDHVALAFLGGGMGAAAAFFVEWVWPR